MNHVKVYTVAASALSVVVCVLAVAGVDSGLFPPGVSVGLFMAALYAAVVEG